MRVARQLFSPVVTVLAASLVAGVLVTSAASATSRNEHVIAPSTPVTTFATGLDYPIGVATDAVGDVYVASFCMVACGSGTLISEYSPAGARVASYVVSGASNPLGLVISDNHLYIDTYGAGAWQVALAGDPSPGSSIEVASSADFGDGACRFTDSITADPSGNLYFGGQCGNVFEMASRGGLPATFAPPTLVATLPGSPLLSGIAYNAGTLAVASFYAGTISLVRGGSIVSSSWASGLSLPRGLAYDASGNLYVAGGGSLCSTPHGVRRAACSVVPGSAPSGGTITRIDPSGNVAVLASGIDITSDVALDPTGNLFATELYLGNVIELAATTSGPSVSASEVSSFPAGTSITATWTGAPGATSFTCTLLYGFDAPSTFKVTTMGHSCTFSGLDSHALYGVRVVANYPDGSTSVATSTFARSLRVLNARIVCARGTNRRVVVGANPRCPLGWHRI